MLLYHLRSHYGDRVNIINDVVYHLRSHYGDRVNIINDVVAFVLSSITELRIDECVIDAFLCR